MTAISASSGFCARVVRPGAALPLLAALNLLILLPLCHLFFYYQARGVFPDIPLKPQQSVPLLISLALLAAFGWGAWRDVFRKEDGQSPAAPFHPACAPLPRKCHLHHGLSSSHRTFLACGRQGFPGQSNRPLLHLVRGWFVFARGSCGISPLAPGGLAGFDRQHLAQFRPGPFWRQPGLGVVSICGASINIWGIPMRFLAILALPRLPWPHLRFPGAVARQPGDGRRPLVKGVDYRLRLDSLAGFICCPRQFDGQAFPPGRLGDGDGDGSLLAGGGGWGTPGSAKARAIRMGRIPTTGGPSG